MTLEPGAKGTEAAGAVTRGFLFADLRGYTAFVEANGDTAGAALLDVYRRLVRETIAHHGGAEIRTEGDSFYVVFPSASSAVAGGLGIVAAAAAESAADPEHPIRVGVGVHAGEAVEAPEGYVGSAVNIAARVCAQAGAGEVLVSETVRSLIRTSGRLTFSPKGRRQLKGIDEAIALFRVEPAGTAPAGIGTGKDRRVVLLIGAGAVLGLALVAALVLRGAPGASPSPSPSAPVAAATSTPEIIERIAYTALRSADQLQPATCDIFAGEARLWLTDPAGEAPIRLLAPGDVWETQAAWSPDGTKIAYVGVKQAGTASLYVTPADGSAVRDLLPPTPPEGIDADAVRWRRPSWSADSRHLLFLYGDGGIWSVAADGSDLKQLIAPLPAPPEPTPDPQGNAEPVFPPQFGQASWMPDGRIAVEVTEQTKDPKRGTPLTAINVAAADGSGLAPLAGLPTDISVTEPAWSVDGRLAFLGGMPPPSLDEPPEYSLYVLDVGAAQARKLPVAAGVAAAPAWSPDGTKLVFGAGTLHIIGADGSGLVDLPAPSDRAACWPTWGRTTDDALPQPTASLAPGATPATQAFHLGELAPGPYQTEVFRPRTRFVVGPGWEGGRNNVDDFALVLVAGGEIDAGVIQVVVDGPCLDSPTETIGPSPRDLITHLQGNRYLTVSDPFPINVAGHSGLRVDVDVAKLPTEKDCQFFRPRVPLFIVGDGTYSLLETEHIRVVSIDVGGQPVTFLFNREPDSFLQQMQAVIDSLTFP
jgi:class 3 adenylate cyclase/dipeptidyl aminopeptidase/acylaminoacyl peptidase